MTKITLTELNEHGIGLPRARVESPNTPLDRRVKRPQMTTPEKKVLDGVRWAIRINKGAGATAYQVASLLGRCANGHLNGHLKRLVDKGYLTCQIAPHRPNITKYLYQLV